MFVIYVRLNGKSEIAPIPCKAIFESSILGSEYMELHGVDERIKDNILPKATIKTMTIRKKTIESIVSFAAYSENTRKEISEEKPKEEKLEPNVEEEKSEEPKKRRYVKSGKYSKKKKGQNKQ